MNQPVVLTFFDYKISPKPDYEHFLSTVTLDHLASEVCDHYRELRPDLPGMFDHTPAEFVRLDAHGPIYGGGNVVVTTPSGYRVGCPASHADVVADYLRDLAAGKCSIDFGSSPAREPKATSFVIFRCMYHLAAIPRDDVPFLADAFAKKAQDAAIQRTLTRATCFPVDGATPPD